MAGGACVAEGGACVAGGVHARGHVWQRGACVAGEVATAAGATHHTGMHSCYQVCSVQLFYLKDVKFDSFLCFTS